MLLWSISEVVGIGVLGVAACGGAFRVGAIGARIAREGLAALGFDLVGAGA